MRVPVATALTAHALPRARRPLNVQRYLTRMAERGFDTATVLRGTGIDPARLSDPAYPVSTQASVAAIANMIRLTGDSSLGLSFGQETRIADLGIIGHAIMSAHSVRHATSLWNQFCGSLLGSLVHPQIVEGSGNWIMRLNTPLPSGVVRLFCLEEMMAMGLHLLAPLYDRPLVVEQVRVAYPPPPHAHRYFALLGCPVSFCAETTEIVVAHPPLDAPLITNDTQMNEICQRHCQQVLRGIGADSPLLSRLRSLFLHNASQLPSLEDAAQTLGLSPRTLRRRLQEQGTHYQALRRDFYLDLAGEYLRSRQLAPKQVGYLLGFRFPTTFRRAFKSWTGQTVRQYCRSDAVPR